MTIEENKQRFLAELKKVNRPGMDKLLDFIINESDFFKAPTSIHYHLSCPGGLLQHSLNVLDVLRSFLKENDDGTYSMMLNGVEVERVTADNVIIMALLHDICKVNFYDLSWRNKKINGQWEEVPYYEIKDQHPLGHGEKSVIMLQSYIQLDRPELYAIRWHMGFPEKDNIITFTDAIEKYPVVWALHSADMLTSHIVEDKEDNKSGFCM